MYATNLANVLRAAGLSVHEYPGWQTRGHTPLTDVRGIVWHHDASPRGDSAGVPDYLRRGMDNPASPGDAQLWVGRAGVWHIMGAGKAWHAGRVNETRFANEHSLGIETDHTTAEDWPPAQLDALRRGTAAILTAYGLGADALGFHKTVCVPAGRKTDPDGLTLADERAAVARLMHPTTTTAAKGAASTSAPSAPSGGPRTLGRGDTGADVARLQGELARVFPTYAGSVARDGDYGPATETAVREFQRRAGVGVDGMVGPATRAALARFGVRL